MNTENTGATATNPTKSTARIGLGGGCHWCTEAVFQSLRGVVMTEQGWIASVPPHDYFSEAVIVHYEASSIPLEALIRIHLHTHSAASKHSMRKKYRSAVYFFEANQEEIITKTLQAAQADFDRPLITLRLPFAAFRASPEQYQNYYRKNRGRPFCNAYIEPKFTKLMQEFSHHYQGLE